MKHIGRLNSLTPKEKEIRIKAILARKRKSRKERNK